MGHGIRWTGWRRSIRRGVVLAMLSTLVLILGVPSAHAASISVKRNDYNADGISDIVAMIVGGDCLYRWNGNSSGSFNAGQSVGCGWSNYFDTLTAVGDINDDGNGDLVAIFNNTLYRWFGTGGGNFTFAGTYGSGWGRYFEPVGVGDISGDGVGDLVAFNFANNTKVMYRWFGNGNGGFNFAGTAGSGWEQYHDYAGVGDINSDGLSRGDLVAVADGVLHRWFGTSGGNFSYGGTLGSGWGAYDQLAGLGNLGGGGAGDLVAINVGASELWRWFGNGSGGFGAGSRLISFVTDWRIQ